MSLDFGAQVAQVVRDLKEIERQVPEVLPPTTEEVAQMLLAEARRRAPVRTGKLRDSGRVVEDKKESRPGRAAYRVCFEFYGKFQEYGTSRHAAQPFLRPAADMLKDQLGKHIEFKVSRVISGIKKR